MQRVEEWEALATLVSERKPAWETLSTLLKQVASLPEADELNRQARAVRDERRLLEPTDPVPDIRKTAVAVLRKAVTTVHSAFCQMYKEQMAALEANANWQKLSDEQQRQILEAEGIDTAPSLSVGSEAELLRTLEQTSLPSWKIKTDALPQQFIKAALQAAKLLEPKTQQVRLTSPTLKTEEDIKAWLAQTEVELIEKLQDGPIVIA